MQYASISVATGFTHGVSTMKMAALLFVQNSFNYLISCCPCEISRCTNMCCFKVLSLCVREMKCKYKCKFTSPVSITTREKLIFTPLFYFIALHDKYNIQPLLLRHATNKYAATYCAIHVGNAYHFNDTQKEGQNL